jgi:hypothetical protein
MPHKEPGFGACADCGVWRALRRRGLCYSCYERQRHAQTLTGRPHPAHVGGAGRSVSKGRAQYCWPCYTVRRRAGATCAPIPESPPDPPGPARCGECGQVFSAWLVRSAHTLMDLRCLVGPELAARGWRQDARGVWWFPAPERVQSNSRPMPLVEELSNANPDRI